MYPYIHIMLPSYTVMAMIGGFFALGWMYIRLDRFEIPFSSFLRMTAFSAAGGFLGAKLLFALTQIPWLIRHFSLQNAILLIPQSGLVFYGGLFGVIASLCFLTRHDDRFRQTIFRFCVPAMPLFHVFGRVGCFLTGCCYGKKLSHPFQIGTISFERIPVQLIEALVEGILFIVLVQIDRKKEKADLLKCYLILYAVCRFVLEFFRGDSIRGVYLGLSTAQWISLMILGFYAFSAVLGDRFQNPLSKNPPKILAADHCSDAVMMQWSKVLRGIKICIYSINCYYCRQEIRNR